MRDSTAMLRRAYAERIAAISGVRSPALVEAFAAVPREAFLGPGPWKILDPGKDTYHDTPDADPVHVYENACVAIDPARELNNGEPGLHMGLLFLLAPTAGEHVVQVGAGTGYYTAILAELVGARGRVTAIEYDEALARRATDNLAAYPQVAVVYADGTGFDTGSANAIYVCAGVTGPSATWLDNLAVEGRLILPLTTAANEGQILEVRHLDTEFSARFVGSCGFIPCVSARDSDSEALLAEAFERGGSEQVLALRRESHSREPSCWLHGKDYCLSSRRDWLPGMKTPDQGNGSSPLITVRHMKHR